MKNNKNNKQNKKTKEKMYLDYEHFLSKYIPMKIIINPNIRFIIKYKNEKGFYILYINKQYAIPANIVLSISEKLFEKLKDKVIKIENNTIRFTNDFIAIVKLHVRSIEISKKNSNDEKVLRNVLIIEMLDVEKEIKKIKYVLILNKSNIVNYEKTNIKEILRKYYEIGLFECTNKSIKFVGSEIGKYSIKPYFVYISKLS